MLIEEDQSGRPNLAIADFGLSCFFSPPSLPTLGDHSSGNIPKKHAVDEGAAATAMGSSSAVRSAAAAGRPSSSRRAEMTPEEILLEEWLTKDEQVNKCTFIFFYCCYSCYTESLFQIYFNF